MTKRGHSTEAETPPRKRKLSPEAAAAAQELDALQEVDRILARPDREIPEAHQRVDALLSRLRTTRIAV